MINSFFFLGGTTTTTTDFSNSAELEETIVAQQETEVLKNGTNGGEVAASVSVSDAERKRKPPRKSSHVDRAVSDVDDPDVIHVTHDHFLRFADSLPSASVDAEDRRKSAPAQLSAPAPRLLLKTSQSEYSLAQGGSDESWLDLAIREAFNGWQIVQPASKDMRESWEVIQKDAADQGLSMGPEQCAASMAPEIKGSEGAGQCDEDGYMAFSEEPESRKKERPLQTVRECKEDEYLASCHAEAVNKGDAGKKDVGSSSASTVSPVSDPVSVPQRGRCWTPLARPAAVSRDAPDNPLAGGGLQHAIKNHGACANAPGSDHCCEMVESGGRVWFHKNGMWHSLGARPKDSPTRARKASTDDEDDKKVTSHDERETSMASVAQRQMARLHVPLLGMTSADYVWYRPARTDEQGTSGEDEGQPFSGGSTETLDGGQWMKMHYAQRFGAEKVEDEADTEDAASVSTASGGWYWGGGR